MPAKRSRSQSPSRSERSAALTLRASASSSASACSAAETTFASGRVADDDAGGRRRGHVDVVDADAGAADHAQLGAAAISSASTGVAERTTSASALGERGREIGAGLELDDLAGLAQQLQPRVGDRLGDDADAAAHRGSAASSASRPALQRALVGRAELPEAQTLPAVRPRPPSMM